MVGDQKQGFALLHDASFGGNAQEELETKKKTNCSVTFACSSRAVPGLGDSFSFEGGGQEELENLA